MENTHGGGGAGKSGHLRGTYLERTGGGPLNPRSELSSYEQKPSPDGRSSTKEAADFDEVGSVMGGPSRDRRDSHFPPPSPLGLSPAPPRFADLMVW